MKKLLLLSMLLSASATFAQNKWISVRTQVGGSMQTFSLYQKQNDNSYLKIKSRDEDSGRWMFDSLAAGVYRVHVDMAYTKYLPTWHPMKLVWDDAEDIDLTATDTFICDAGMIPNPVFTGPGSVGGVLNEGLLKAQGDPLKNVNVMLVDQNDALVKMGKTNDSGVFAISNLPLGTYTIKVDVVNASTANSKSVVLDSTHQSASVDLTVNKTGTQNTGLAMIAGQGDLKMYPNPVSQNLFVETSGMASVSIYSITGKLVHTTTLLNQTSINMQQFENGLYLVQVVQGNTTHTYRIVKN